MIAECSAGEAPSGGSKTCQRRFCDRDMLKQP